jgi:hypothetical protein
MKPKKLNQPKFLRSHLAPQKITLQHAVPPAESRMSKRVFDEEDNASAQLPKEERYINKKKRKRVRHVSAHKFSSLLLFILIYFSKTPADTRLPLTKVLQGKGTREEFLDVYGPNVRLGGKGIFNAAHIIL